MKLLLDPSFTSKGFPVQLGATLSQLALVERLNARHQSRHLKWIRPKKDLTGKRIITTSRQIGRVIRKYHVGAGIRYGCMIERVYQVVSHRTVERAVAYFQDYTMQDGRDAALRFVKSAEKELSIERYHQLIQLFRCRHEVRTCCM